MISNPFFLVSLLISALFAFFTVAVFVEVVLLLFKVKRGRVRHVLRIFPYISLLLDPLLNSFSVGSWLNPLNCGSCMQKILLSVVFPELKDHLDSHEISLLAYLGLGISHTVFSLAFMLFLIMTFYHASRMLWITCICGMALRRKMETETICSRKIGNVSLFSRLQKNNIQIFISEKITIPMATYSKAIFIPKDMVEKLPEEEFQAIVAHELEHLLWRDPVVRLLSQFVSAVFWWVPTRLWQQKLEFDQEIACDQSILRYGIAEEFLASALIKVTTAAREKHCETLCYFSNKKHASLRRVHMMLNVPAPPPKSWEWLSGSAVVVGSLIGLACVLWR